MNKYILITIIAIGCLESQARIPFSNKSDMTILKPYTSDTIIWTEGKQFTWDDFQCKPDTNQKYLAATTVTIECKWNCIDRKFQFTTRALFSKSRSWVKKEGQKEYILIHEQHHFDLTEVYARMIKKELRLLTNPCENQEKIKNIIAKLKVKHDQEQIKYDIETNHGGNKTVQKTWEENIQKLLNDLEIYK